MPDIDGIINLNKPPGKTSFQMVALVRKLSGERKVGHSGTLDPDATGVLPILLGRATKLARFITDSLKTYRAQIEFGSATTTYDASGTVTQKGEPDWLSLEQIEPALASFRGPIEQVPPMYSAIKHHGKPLYILARAGIEVPRKPRKVIILRLDVLDWRNPLLTIEVECSKGTYIRSLAHDLGQALGCGAHLKELARIQSGPFHIDKSIPADQLEEAFKHRDRQLIIHPLDTVLSHLSAVTVTEADEEAIAHGRPFPRVETQPYPTGEPGRAYTSDGRFLALIRLDAGSDLWWPQKVFV